MEPRDGGDLKELAHPENPNPQKRNNKDTNTYNFFLL